VSLCSVCAGGGIGDAQRCAAWAARGTPTAGHPPDWRQGEPSKITVRGGAERHHAVTRAQRAPFTVILPGSRLECRDGRPRAAAVGGRDGCQRVTGGSRGNARAAARRVPQVQRRSCQPDRGQRPASASRPPRRARPPVTSPARARYLAWDHAPDGARRAPRAVEDVRESPHGSALRHSGTQGTQGTQAQALRHSEEALGGVGGDAVGVFPNPAALLRLAGAVPGRGPQRMASQRTPLPTGRLHGPARHVNTSSEGGGHTSTSHGIVRTSRCPAWWRSLTPRGGMRPEAAESPLRLVEYVIAVASRTAARRTTYPQLQRLVDNCGHKRILRLLHRYPQSPSGFQAENASWDRVKAIAAMRRPGRAKRRRTGPAALLARQIRGLAGRLRGAHELCRQLSHTPESVRPHTRSPGPKHRSLRRSSFPLLFRANEVTHRRRRRWRPPFPRRPSLRRLIVSLAASARR
jgi:hypothetical protein